MMNNSKIALGTMQFLWTTTEKEAFRILDAYYYFGGTIIDTADMYTNWAPGLHGGEAETIIGKWIRKRKSRDKFTLMSKVRARVWEGADGEGLSRQHILKAVDKTLQRLQTDYLDIYISHWPDTDTPIEETLLAYQELIKEGKVRAIGCSNYTNNELRQALLVGEEVGAEYTYLQSYYNLIDRIEFEHQIFPLIKEFNLTVFIYGPLAGGFLTGAYRKDKPFPEHAREAFIKKKMTDENFKKLDIINAVAQKYHATISQVSLAWLLQKGFTPLIGADTITQVQENMKATNISLATKDIELLDSLT